MQLLACAVLAIGLLISSGQILAASTLDTLCIDSKHAGLGLIAATSRQVESVAISDKTSALLPMHVPGMSTAVWRGLVIAEPASSPLRNRLSSAVAPNIKPLLFHSSVPFVALPPDYEIILDAIRALAKGDTSPQAKHKIQAAAYWLAGGTLDSMLQVTEGIANGHTQLLMSVHQPVQNDACKYHITLLVPDTRRSYPLTITLHEPKYDLTHKTNTQSQAPAFLPANNRDITMDVQKDDSRHNIFSEDALLAKPITIDLRDLPLQEVFRKLPIRKPLEFTISPDVKSNRRFSIIAHKVPLSNVITALARISHCIIDSKASGPYILRQPTNVQEQLYTALPLHLWTSVVSDQKEYAFEYKQAYSSLQKSWLPKRTTASQTVYTPLEQLDIKGRRAIYRIIGQRFVSALMLLLEDLPYPNGDAPVALFEDPVAGEYELTSPSASEVVQGLLYLRLKCDIQGTSGLIAPMEAQK